MTEREALAALLARMEGVEQQPRHTTEAEWLAERGVTLRSEPDEGLDVERLAQAMRDTTNNRSSDWTHPGNAPAIAAEYAALAAKEPK